MNKPHIFSALTLCLISVLGHLGSVNSRNGVIVWPPSPTPWYHPTEGLVGH